MNTEDYYFIGKDNNGKRVWLEKPSWDCGWYWGFGYLQTMCGNREPSAARDIDCHTHWDSCVAESHKNAHDWFIETFGEPTTDIWGNPRKGNKGTRMCRFTDKQVWRICELMATAYTLRETAEVLGRGKSNYGENPCVKIIKNTREAKRINSKVLPAIFAEIGKIFDEVDKTETPSKPFKGIGWREAPKKTKK